MLILSKEYECLAAGVPHHGRSIIDCATMAGPLLLLRTTTASSFGGLDSLLVTLSRAALEAGHQTSSLLEGTLEVTSGRLAEDVDLDQVGLEGALEGDDGLDKKRVGVFEVQMHESHHADTHELGAEQLLDLLRVVGVDRGGHELGFLGRAHGGRFDIFKGREICPLLSAAES
jgi:hypothetical protein